MHIGTHNLRSAGATAAANAGVLDHLFLPHGLFPSRSSVSAKDGYVKDSLASRLSVSKALGIKVFCFSWSCPGDRPIWPAGLGFSS